MLGRNQKYLCIHSFVSKFNNVKLDLALNEIEDDEHKNKVPREHMSKPDFVKTGLVAYLEPYFRGRLRDTLRL